MYDVQIMEMSQTTNNLRQVSGTPHTEFIRLTLDRRYEIWSFVGELLKRMSLSGVPIMGSKLRRIAYPSEPSQSMMLQMLGWVAFVKVEIS